MGKQGIRNRFGEDRLEGPKGSPPGEGDGYQGGKRGKGRPKSRPRWYWDVVDSLILGVVTLYAIACPFCKVEESFNLQATHDLLYHRTRLEQYDHHEFPGVVPRTFLGPGMLAGASSPLVGAMIALQLPRVYVQIVVRVVLGAITTLAFSQFRHGLRQAFSLFVANTVGWLTLTQFHLLFYFSRPLPNTFALIMVLWAARYVFQKDLWKGYVLLTFAGCIFRAEMVLILGPMVLLDLVLRRAPFWSTATIGVSSAVVAVGISVIVDSAFWSRWLWPEGEVFWFNTVDNRSHEWGVSPWHWYLTSAMPKATTAAFPVAVLSLLYVSCVALASLLGIRTGGQRGDASFARRVLQYTAPFIIFVALYSILPHKELRFIFYAIPFVNLLAACLLERLLRSNSSLLNALYALFCVGIACSILISGLSLSASYYNYPGGHALQALHTALNPVLAENCSLPGPPLALLTKQPRDFFPSLRLPFYRVHIGNLAAQSGVSRFGELPCGLLVYDKTEHLSDQDLAEYHFLLAERVVPGFEVIHREEGFDGLKRSYPFLKFSTKIYVLVRSDLAESVVPWTSTYHQQKRDAPPKPWYPVHEDLEHIYE
eukprot:CAMPEP_0119159138 /NCGR_PEP_ID=MMETSP1310-20130426/53612_1 /TAXON_ID=464262 /ORGANISM="Genus nov. species nov., Strain RCC2339" /LENGTH=596 /DNA_ID=CAMNT_0007151767 /DNA_START=65 /DNA_END=1855 /DNA_ORIENTATION=+